MKKAYEAPKAEFVDFAVDTTLMTDDVSLPFGSIGSVESTEGFDWE